MTERESAHPPPQRLEGDAMEPSDATVISDATDTAVTSPDGDTREPRDRLLPQRAGPDGQDRPDDADVDDDGDKRTVAHVSKSKLIVLSLYKSDTSVLEGTYINWFIKNM